MASGWKLIGKTAHGANHVRQNRPNQDFILFGPNSEAQPVILAVSDGHGSPKCFRSAIGAEFAAEVAVCIVSSFLQKAAQFPIHDVQEVIEHRLTADIVHCWSEKVLGHCDKTPFSTEEIARAEKEVGSSLGEYLSTSTGRLRAYGATLLITAITPTFILYMQLGDGDILAITGGPYVAERPLPDDPTLFANDTTSLCMENAKSLFRIKIEPLESSAPALIMVSTDGYANAFASDKDFLKAGTDIAAMLRSDGLTYVEDNLWSWLDEASREGSGDDVTVGLICSEDLFKTLAVEMKPATPGAPSSSSAM